MSPEQLQGRDVTGRSDLFALAVSLFQLLTGQLPFRADSMPGLMLRIAQEPHPRVRALNPAAARGAGRVLRSRTRQGTGATVLARAPSSRRRCATSTRPPAKANRPMRLKGKLRCVGVTDTGRVREHNEDTFGTDADIGLVVLADGMGGYKAGEVASGITVRTIMGLLKEAVERERPRRSTTKPSASAARASCCGTRSSAPTC
jgi:serine/threonine protein kinase